MHSASRKKDSYYPETPSHDHNASVGEYGGYPDNDMGNGVTEDPFNRTGESWYQTETKSTLKAYETPPKRRNNNFVSPLPVSNPDLYESGAPSPSSSIVRVWVGSDTLIDRAQPPTEDGKHKSKSSSVAFKENRRRSVSNASAPRSRSSTLHSNNLHSFYNLQEETSPEMNAEINGAQGHSTPPRPASQKPLLFMTTPERPILFDPRSPVPGCRPRADASHLKVHPTKTPYSSTLRNSGTHPTRAFEASPITLRSPTRSVFSRYSTSSGHSSIPVPVPGKKRANPNTASKKKPAKRVESSVQPPPPEVVLATSRVLNRMALEKMAETKMRANKKSAQRAPTQDSLSTSQIVTRMALENLAKKKKPAEKTKKSANDVPRSRPRPRTDKSSRWHLKQNGGAEETRPLLSHGSRKRASSRRDTFGKAEVTPTKDDAARDPKAMKKILGYIPRTLKWRVDYGAVKSKINSRRPEPSVSPRTVQKPRRESRFGKYSQEEDGMVDGMRASTDV